jgi:putative flippase GtrA
MIDRSVVLRFLFVGGSTTILYFGLIFALVEGLALHTTVSSSVAYIVVGFYNYLLHYHWTFATDAPHGLALVKYLLTCVGGLVLNALVMHVGVMLVPVHYMVVQLFAFGVVVCWSLCISTVWVFSRK